MSLRDVGFVVVRCVYPLFLLYLCAPLEQLCEAGAAQLAAWIGTSRVWGRSQSGKERIAIGSGLSAICAAKSIRVCAEIGFEGNRETRDWD